MVAHTVHGTAVRVDRELGGLVERGQPDGRRGELGRARVQRARAQSARLHARGARPLHLLGTYFWSYNTYYGHTYQVRAFFRQQWQGRAFEDIGLRTSTRFEDIDTLELWLAWACASMVKVLP